MATLVKARGYLATHTTEALTDILGLAAACALIAAAFVAPAMF